MPVLAPATLALIIQGVQAIIAAAPGIIAVAEKAKEFFANLFAAGLIDADTQNRINSNVDAWCEAALNGTLGPAWDVEPD